MASTYSQNLKLTLIGNGDQSGTWGTTTNTNLGTLLEQAITGVQSIVMVDADYTLSNYNGTSDEARNAVLVVTGTNTAVRNIITPSGQSKIYVVTNNTTGGYGIGIKVSGGSAITIPSGATQIVYTDGTTFSLAASTTTVAAGTGISVSTVGTTATVSNTGILSVAGTTSQITATTVSGATTLSLPSTINVNTSGNAATATSATSATSAGSISNSGGWSVTPSGTTLYLNYNGTNVGKLDSSGNLTVAGNVTAYGTV